MKKRILWWIVPLFVIVSGAAALWHAKSENGGSEFLVQRQQPADEINVGEEINAGEETEHDPLEVSVQPDPQRIYVHVCGAVVCEGVYELPKNSRVVDAVTAAGGFSEDADRSYHNLAGLLNDGRKVYVPTKEETEELAFFEREAAVEKTEAAGGKHQKLNLNTAGKEELMTLPGIGESKAESILKYRSKIGHFQNVEEITNVSGIGPALLEQIRDLVVAE